MALRRDLFGQLYPVQCQYGGAGFIAMDTAYNQYPCWFVYALGGRQIAQQNGAALHR